MRKGHQVAPLLFLCFARSATPSIDRAKQEILFFSLLCPMPFARRALGSRSSLGTGQRAALWVACVPRTTPGLCPLDKEADQRQAEQQHQPQDKRSVRSTSLCHCLCLGHRHREKDQKAHRVCLCRVTRRGCTAPRGDEACLAKGKCKAPGNENG